MQANSFLIINHTIYLIRVEILYSNMLKLIRWKMKNLVSGFSFQEEENRDAKLGSLELDISGLWLPLCQNESLCQTIRMKMCLICSVIFMEVKFIFMSKVLHEESL